MIFTPRFGISTISTAILTITLACASTNVSTAPAPAPAPAVPAWVLRTPVEPGKLYAVGVVGRVMFPQIAHERAADAARNQLAKSLQAKVESVILVVQRSDNRNTVNEAFAVEATTLATNAVMGQSTILEVWTDTGSAVPNGEEGATYALSMIQVDDLPQKLGETAKKYLTPEQARELQKQATRTFTPR